MALSSSFNIPNFTSPAQTAIDYSLSVPQRLLANQNQQLMNKNQMIINSNLPDKLKAALLGQQLANQNMGIRNQYLGPQLQADIQSTQLGNQGKSIDNQFAPGLYSARNQEIQAKADQQRTLANMPFGGAFAQDPNLAPLTAYLAAKQQNMPMDIQNSLKAVSDAKLNYTQGMGQSLKANLMFKNLTAQQKNDIGSFLAQGGDLLDIHVDPNTNKLTFNPGSSIGRPLSTTPQGQQVPIQNQNMNPQQPMIPMRPGYQQPVMNQSAPNGPMAPQQQQPVQNTPVSNDPNDIHNPNYHPWDHPGANNSAFVAPNHLTTATASSNYTIPDNVASKLSSMLQAGAIKNTATADSIKRALFARNIDKTLVQIDPKALMVYSGVEGRAQYAKDMIDSQLHKNDPQWLGSKAYQRWEAFNYYAPKADQLAGQIRQFYGDSIQPSMREHLESLTNPSSLKYDPKTAYNRLAGYVGTLRPEENTYREALTSVLPYAEVNKNAPVFSQSNNNFNSPSNTAYGPTGQNTVQAGSQRPDMSQGLRLEFKDAKEAAQYASTLPPDLLSRWHSQMSVIYGDKK